jgi:hypothetical protein
MRADWEGCAHFAEDQSGLATRANGCGIVVADLVLTKAQ